MKSSTHILVIVFASLASIALVIGCKSTVQNARELKSGLTKQETIEVLGCEPTSVMSPHPGVEVCRFKLSKQRLYALKVPEHTYYLVRFVNGRVDAYGTERDLRKARIDLNTAPPPQPKPE